MTKQKGMILALSGLIALGFAGGARADLQMNYAQQAAISPTGVSLRDIAVNKNPNSPYYGYVYAASATDVKVHILRPARPEDGSGSAGLEDTGLTISASTGANLFGVAVGKDDSVWLGVFGTGNIETAPPVPPTGTDVAAVPQFTVTGGIRGIAMTGTLESARVWVQTNDVKVKLFTGGASSWDTAGTFTEQWATDLKTISANVQVGYGLGADSAGNAYAGLSYNAAGADAPIIAKVKLDGTIDTGWGGKRPPFTSIANSLADADVVEDASLPGGGYVYWGGRQVTGGVNKRIVHRFRLDNGDWLDSFGPAAASGFAPPTDATYSVLDVDNAASPHYFGADDKGNLYLNSGNQTKVTKVVASQPLLVKAGDAHSAGDEVKSSPTVVEGVVYFGASDGRLYAYTTADGNPVDGFPVDVADLLGQPDEQLLGRPAVYYTDPDGDGPIEPAKHIYFTTSGGFICRLDADGTNLVHNVVSLNSGGVDATPAVLSDGTVYVGLYDGTAARVYKFDADLGDSIQSAALGYGNMSSVAVVGNNVFVGLSSAASPKLAVLNANNLDVLTTFDGEAVSAPPYVSQGFMHFGTLEGNFYRVNAATGALDATYGDSGQAVIGAPISTSPFCPSGLDLLLVASDHGVVYGVDGHGVVFTVHDTGNPDARVGGVVATPDSLGFGTSDGAFYVVPAELDGIQVYRGHGPFTGTTAYDPETRRFLLGSDDGNVYAFAERRPASSPD